MTEAEEARDTTRPALVQTGFYDDRDIMPRAYLDNFFDNFCTAEGRKTTYFGASADRAD